MKKALLAVSFGTSFHDTLEKNIVAIEKSLDAAFPDRTLVRAFTSNMIMKKLRERDGIIIPNVAEALEKLCADGYTDIVIQPTHVLNGEEYDKLCSLAMPYGEKFEKIAMGAPLLTEISDYHEVVKAILTRLPEKKDDTSIAYMGHGTEHHANAVYAMIEYVLRDIGRDDIHIGTVEGYPALYEVIRRMEERKTVKNVILLPFMIVAGDHAKNDLAGDEEDSWKTLLEEKGYNVSCILEGLGENPEIHKIFVKHAQIVEQGE